MLLPRLICNHAPFCVVAAIPTVCLHCFSALNLMVPPPLIVHRAGVNAAVKVATRMPTIRIIVSSAIQMFVVSASWPITTDQSRNR
jgi:hypothetical protein